MTLTNRPKDLIVSIGRRRQVDHVLGRHHEFLHGVVVACAHGCHGRLLRLVGTDLFEADGTATAASLFLAHGDTCCLCVFLELEDVVLCVDSSCSNNSLITQRYLLLCLYIRG